MLENPQFFTLDVWHVLSRSFLYIGLLVDCWSCPNQRFSWRFISGVRSEMHSFVLFITLIHVAIMKGHSPTSMGCRVIWGCPFLRILRVSSLHQRLTAWATVTTYIKTLPEEAEAINIIIMKQLYSLAFFVIWSQSRVWYQILVVCILCNKMFIILCLQYVIPEIKNQLCYHKGNWFRFWFRHTIFPLNLWEDKKISHVEGNLKITRQKGKTSEPDHQFLILSELPTYGHMVLKIFFVSKIPLN